MGAAIPVPVSDTMTEMVHVAAAATEAPQVLVWLKSPLAAIVVMVRAADPVLVSVTTCAALAVFNGWFPKVRIAGEKLTAGAVIPVPVNETVCGLPLASSVTESAPVRDPVAVGGKVTEIVHDPAAAKETR